MSPVQLSRRGRIGLIEVDNPPVNALSQAVRQGLADRIAEALADREVEALVIACKGRTFIAGADIREFGKPPEPPQLRDVVQSIEDADKPVVAAIHGTAFGGGLELALACHYRVAAENAQCGLPEVKLGIIPGAGGTQRLPRLIGAKAALDIIATGEPIRAPRAKELGLIDRICGSDLLADAVAFAQSTVGKPLRRTSQLTEHTERDRADLGFLNEYEKKTAKAKRGFEAPQRAIDAVRAAVTLPFQQGLDFERDTYLQLRFSDQSKAQRHVFFAEREATKIPDVPADTPLIPVQSVGIIGAGTMGAGIAIACASAGLRVHLLDRERAYVEKGLSSIAKSYQSSVQRGRLSDAQMQERVARIKGALSYDELAEVDLVIEAVFEEMPLKKEIFAQLDRVCKRGAILATNTSTLDVNEIAAVTSRPQDVIGLHFFSPANVMRLLEIVRGAATSKSVIATSMKLAKTLDKIGVLVGVCPGFVGNRILYAYRREAFFLLEEGALPQQVDKALTDFGFAMGPFAVSDLAGLDISWRVRKAQGTPQGQRYSGTIADRLCEQGHFGQKTGQGFYKYEPGDRTPKPYPELEALVLQTSRELGIERRSVSAEEIVERCIYAMINEGCQILDEGVAVRAGDIDLIWLNGYGFPGYRGGPMCYAELVGLPKVYETICRFREQHGSAWEPSPLLRRLVEANRSFEDLYREQRKREA